jgi:hypothetical protein
MAFTLYIFNFSIQQILSDFAVGKRVRGQAFKMICPITLGPYAPYLHAPTAAPTIPASFNIWAGSTSAFTVI